MNLVETTCYKCSKEITISVDEFMTFKNGYCSGCITPETLMIRNKIVLGFYKLPEIKEQIAEKVAEVIINKEQALKQSGRG